METNLEELEEAVTSGGNESQNGRTLPNVYDDVRWVGVVNIGGRTIVSTSRLDESGRYTYIPTP